MSSSAPLADFMSALETSLSDASFGKLTLRAHKGVDATLKTIDIKPVLIKRQERLSFTYHYKTRDIVKNFTPDEAADLVRQGLAADFAAATLLTTQFDLLLENNGLRRRPPSQTAPASLDHDRAKQRLIGTQEKPYLAALGITDQAGTVLKTAQDKYRQINKYIEILSSLLKAIPPERLNKVVDMGSGKGYLTFALYDYLTNNLKLNVEVTGVEFRADLVSLCNTIAAASGFKKLGFVEGSIEHYDSTGANILLALHACDTATDDAIFKGIEAGSELIVVAPCCHKQVRREIEKHKASNDLDFLLKHGIFVERQSEMVTDGLRALLLEYAGYSTKVFEFISDAHTPKNVLIVGTKGRASPAEKSAILAKVSAIKSYFGIGYHHLERLMGLDKADITA
jgi:SAM-dependent methyltransferase